MKWIENLPLETLNAMYWATMSGSWYSNRAADVEDIVLNEIWRRFRSKVSGAEYLEENRPEWSIDIDHDILENLYLLAEL